MTSVTVPSEDPVRVLVVDDSVAVRHVVSATLRAEDDLCVVGTARDGMDAIEKAGRLNPDVVVLDVEMPVLDGLNTLPELHQRCPNLPVVMFSTLTERGAAATLEALARGAVDFATKPSMANSQGAAADCIRRDLVPLVRTWGRIEQARRCREPKTTSAMPATDPAASTLPLRSRVGTRASRRVDAVLIGCSTGGPNALTQIVSMLPEELPVPVLVVQHMPEVFTKLLADRLDARCVSTVKEAEDGEAVEPGVIYIAQGGRHLRVQKQRGRAFLECTSDPPVNFCRPAVDTLFHSAVDVWGDGILAVMLTGMGNDGLDGSTAVVAAGGTVIAQDKASSVVWGMPGAVMRAGLVSEVVSLGGVARAIAERACAPKVWVPA